jgi:hypothetical protein
LWFWPPLILGGFSHFCRYYTWSQTTGTFIQKIYAPSSSLLQGKHLPFTPSPLPLNIFRLFVILSLTQLYRYTPEIFLFSTDTFKYTYRVPLRRIGQEYSAKVYNWVSERITNKRKILRRSGEGEKGRCLPWSKEKEGAYIFWMKQVPVIKKDNYIITLLNSNITARGFMHIFLCCRINTILMQCFLNIKLICIRRKTGENWATLALISVFELHSHNFIF